jgi:hypothetical protein
MKLTAMFATAALTVAAFAQSAQPGDASAPHKKAVPEKKGASKKGADQKDNAAPAKKPDKTKDGAPGDDSGKEPDEGNRYLLEVYRISPKTPASAGTVVPCPLLPNGENKYLTAAEIVELIGDPVPFSVEARGPVRILIYSRRNPAVKMSDDDVKLLQQIKDRINELAGSGKFDVVLRVPHAGSLGNVAEKVNGLSYDELTVVAAGPNRIRISSDSAPDCNTWKQFLKDVRELAWRPHPVSPVDRLFYLSGADVAAALNGDAGAHGGGPDKSATPSITVNAVGAQNSAAGGQKSADDSTGAPSQGKGGQKSPSSAKGGGQAGGGTGNAGGGGKPPGKGGNTDTGNSGASQDSGKSTGDSTPGGTKASAQTSDAAASKPPAPAGATPATPDLLVFSEPAPGDDEAVEEKRRIVAALDLPRPEMLVNIWSVQLSSANPQDIYSSGRAIRDVVSNLNERLQTSIQQAWRTIRDSASDVGFYDPAFYSYVANRFIADTPAASNENTNQAKSQDFLDGRSTTGVVLDDASRQELAACKSSQYCLGYTGLLRPLKPRLTDLLLAVIAADKPIAAADAALNAMENLAGAPAANQTSCEADDRRLYEAFRSAPSGPFFECFRRSAHIYLLNDGAVPHPLGLLRGAVADFLFQYKMAQQYPHEFSPYDLAQSAQSLNTALSPLVDAFNRDITVFQTVLTDRLSGKDDSVSGKDNSNSGPSVADWFPSDRVKAKFSNNGVVSVRTVSGKETLVDTVTQTYLDATNAPTLSQLMASIAQAKDSVPGVIGNNMTAAAATALAGALGSMQSTDAKIGRGLKIDLMPRSLPGASSAEIDVTLNVEETAEPSLYTAGASSDRNDNLSRVAKHDTATKMRVDSMRIFEVSSLSAKLERSRSRFPLLPIPGFEIPYIGSIAGIPRRPASEYHNSIAVLSALVVPTAADLAYGTRYQSDQIVESDDRPVCSLADMSKCSFRAARSMDDLGEVREFHRAMVYCFATGLTGRTPGAQPPPGGCSAIRLSSAPFHEP